MNKKRKISTTHLTKKGEKEEGKKRWIQTK
jgi:hypothetical protein